jgi:hypothetical protein
MVYGNDGPDLMGSHGTFLDVFLVFGSSSWSQMDPLGIRIHGVYPNAGI